MHNCASSESDSISRIRASREAESTDGPGETGVLKGAHPVRIERGRDRACLMLHGWLTSPADFGDLPGAVDAAGWDVFAPLEAGHGTRPADLEQTGAEDLLARARAEYEALRDRYRRVALVGFSMGGTISTLLAAENRPDRLVLIAPFFAVEQKWYYVLPVRWWCYLLSPFARYVKRPPGSIPLNDKSRLGEIVMYAAFPTCAVRQLFKLRRLALEQTNLSTLNMPLLMIYSEGDDVASPAAMRHVFDRLPTGSKREVVFTRSNHHLLHDYDRQEAVRAVVDFLSD